MIKVVCYAKELSNDQNLRLKNDICVESMTDDCPSIFEQPKKIILSIDKKSYVVKADDLITAVENCINNNN